MYYRLLKSGALLMLVIMFMLLSDAVRGQQQEVLPVMFVNETSSSVQALARSLGSVNAVEYKQRIKTVGFGSAGSTIEMHYYYKKPFNLRVETKNGDNINIDIYTQEGMYEYFPSSNVAYYREKWKDGRPITYQLEDKLHDIMVRGKYDKYKTDKIGDKNCEIIRSIDEESGKIYEHRIWISSVQGLELPLKEEFLSDGEVISLHEYEYISVNMDIDSSVFELKQSNNLVIYNAEGIPKLVKDEIEAEKYVKFNMLIPKYIPVNFVINEISIIPPSKSPSVTISYLSDVDTIYFSQRNIRKNELSTTELDKTITVGGKKFAVRKLFNNSVVVRWVKNGIEFEVCGPYTLKDELVKLVQSASDTWISVD